MSNTFLDSHSSVFRDNIKSLKDLSTPKEHEQIHCGKQPVLDGFPYSETVYGIDFDTVRCKWYPWRSGINVPCSVDALVFAGENLFLIEFKSGAVEAASLYRKIYDSLIMLLEKDGQDIKTMRKSVIFIVVATQLQNYEINSIARSIFYKNPKEPWLESEYKNVFDKWKLKNLEGVVVSKTYCMSPNMFNKFITTYDWSSNKTLILG